MHTEQPICIDEKTVRISPSPISFLPSLSPPPLFSSLLPSFLTLSFPASKAVVVNLHFLFFRPSSLQNSNTHTLTIPSSSPFRSIPRLPFLQRGWVLRYVYQNFIAFSLTSPTAREPGFSVSAWWLRNTKNVRLNSLLVCRGLQRPIPFDLWIGGA